MLRYHICKSGESQRDCEGKVNLGIGIAELDCDVSFYFVFESNRMDA